MWFSQYQRISPIKEPEISQSLPFSESYGVIGVERLNDFEEVTLLASGEQPVLALSQRKEGAILSVNSAGWLTEWCWEVGDGWTVSDEMDFEYARSGWVNFSADGTMLILPKEVSKGEVTGYLVRDTYQGELLVRERDSQFGWDFTTGFYLSPGGEIIVDYADGAQFVVGDWEDRIGYPVDLFSSIREEYPIIGQVAIDPEDEFLAIAYETGQVSIGKIELGNYLSNNRQYYLLEEGQEMEIKDLQFNATRTRLAWLTGERVVVIQLQNLLFRIGLDISLNGGELLAFDRTGEILVVAAGEKLIFFDMKRNKQVAEYALETEVTSLHFSRDNRLLIWGDAEGNVHLWGVPLE
jgi:hypothetical protein